MEEFWMIIGLILTGCVVLLTYYFAVVLKELADRLKESRSVISNADQITANVLSQQKAITDAVDSIKSVTGGIEEIFVTVKDQILIPVTFIMSFIDKIKQYVGKNEETEDSEE
jgi:beta-lactamase regulating signal transducer with metallopeptidase domain